MPIPIKVEPAKLMEIYLDEDGYVNDGSPSGGAGKVVPVQYNPETLTVRHTKRAPDSGHPFSELSVTLWFDVTTTLNPLEALTADVQKQTSAIDYFIKSSKPGPWTRGVRFLWSSFTFDGWISQLNETFEYFAADGTPLRASVALTIRNEGMFSKKRSGP